MEIKSVSCIFFSPTGTTETIVKNIAQGMEVEQVEMLDCTRKFQREKNAFAVNSDMAILAVPVYYGRVPESVVPFLNRLKVDGTPVAVVVVYGNREYDDALLELCDISVARGFNPVAGGTFIGEHSYSTSSRPMAHARPDESDIKKARAFGEAIRSKLEHAESLEALKKVIVPGNRPYLVPENLNMIKEVRKALPFTPETDADACTRCGLCAELCPTGAIDPEDVSKIDRWQCIICFACVKNCPEQAKQMTDPNFNGAIEQLQKICLDRKEPETFL